MSDEKHVKPAQKAYAKLFKQYGGIFLSLVVLCIIFSVMNPRFMTVANLMNVLQQIAVIAIAAFGMTWVILLGEIDLSIGSIIAVAGMAAAQAFLAGFGFFPTLVLTLLAFAAASIRQLKLLLLLLRTMQPKSPPRSRLQTLVPFLPVTQ